MGNSWRTTQDISLNITASWAGILENLDGNTGLARFARAGAWNDADMLEVTPAGALLADSPIETCSLADGAAIRAAGPARRRSANQQRGHGPLRALVHHQVAPDLRSRLEVCHRAGRGLTLHMRGGARAQRRQYVCRQLDNFTLGLLTAPELIAFNQDPLGVAGELVWKQGPAEVTCRAHWWCTRAVWHGRSAAAQRASRM